MISGEVLGELARRARCRPGAAILVPSLPLLCPGTRTAAPGHQDPGAGAVKPAAGAAETGAGAEIRTPPRGGGRGGAGDVPRSGLWA